MTTSTEYSPSLVPSLMQEVEMHRFDDKTYLIQQKSYAHQLRVSDYTFNLLKIVDGRNTIVQITEKFNNLYNTYLTPTETYQTLYGKLADFGIVESEKEVVKRSKDGYLALRFIVLPSRVVDKITKPFLFLFKRNLFYSLLSIALVIDLLFLVSVFITKSLTILPLTEPVYFFYILAPLVIMLHELGHATACKNFGAAHGGIGVGFYLFMPIAYADVTDAWKLPSKQRVIVDLGGCFMDLMSINICIALFFVTNNSFWAYMAIGSSFNIVTNLNPFFRFDGYWALVDLLNIPNLRADAFAKLSYFLKYLVSFKIPKLNLSDILFILYGAVSWSMLVSFIYYVLAYQFKQLYRFPIDVYHLVVMLLSQKTIDFSYLQNQIPLILVPIIFYITVWNLCRRRVMTVKDFLFKTIQ